MLRFLLLFYCFFSLSILSPETNTQAVGIYAIVGGSDDEEPTSFASSWFANMSVLFFSVSSSPFIWNSFSVEEMKIVDVYGHNVVNINMLKSSRKMQLSMMHFCSVN